MGIGIGIGIGMGVDIGIGMDMSIGMGIGLGIGLDGGSRRLRLAGDVQAVRLLLLQFHEGGHRDEPHLRPR